MAATLNDSQKIDHLLRRFGLGSGRIERQKYLKLGPEKALDILLNDDRVNEGYPVSPWEFAALPDGRIETGAYQLTGFWALRMLLTNRPLEQKLSLFWHDHFAVDFEKVYELPLMHGYLETIRTKGRGKFRDLLSSLFKQGAIYVFLDQHTSTRIHPNENFARELLELFTLGEGNYTEKDVLESARALTGYSVHYLGTGLQYKYEDLRLLAAKNKLGLSNPCYVPAAHDDTPKTIFGITKNWDADSLIEHLASHPKTARYICTKLWEYFAYAGPTVDIVDKLAAVWKRTDGDIRAVLRTIATSPEFWSDKCVRHRTKSPMDYTIGLYRSFGLGPVILSQRGSPKSDLEPMAKPVRDVAGGLVYLMNKQGMFLLRPPDVGGWEWGEAWINTATTVERLQLANTIFWSGGADRPLAVYMANKIKAEDRVANSEQVVRALADILDVPVQNSHIKSLVEMCDKHGGVQALDNKDRSANLFARVSRLMFAIPEFQLC